MNASRALGVLIALLISGFWAEGAAAQSDDSSGWFDQSAESSRPTLRIVGNAGGDGPYAPPPPDFRSPDSERADPDFAPPVASEPVPVDPDEAERERAEAGDPEEQARAVREFSPHLAPYGFWVDDPFYGRVWVPTRAAVGPGFAPYVSSGHWELTAGDEWLWVSDYPFGWITFHYGRWVWASNGSWGWVPGYTYAPAWVDFRIGSTGYIGWGPVAPYYVWRNGVFVSVGVRRPWPYIYCPTAYVFSPGLHRHVIRDRHRIRSISAHTHHYRPRAQYRGWGPSPAEARIPARALPRERSVARPRVLERGGSSVRSSYQLDESARRSRRSADYPSSRLSGSGLSQRRALSEPSGRDSVLKQRDSSVLQHDSRLSPDRRSSRGASFEREPGRLGGQPRSAPLTQPYRAAEPRRGSMGSRNLYERSLDQRGLDQRSKVRPAERAPARAGSQPRSRQPQGRQPAVRPQAPAARAPEPSRAAPLLRPGVIQSEEPARHSEARTPEKRGSETRARERPSAPRRSRGDSRPARSDRRTRSRDHR
jgi:hypothetical protein